MAPSRASSPLAAAAAALLLLGAGACSDRGAPDRAAADGEGTNAPPEGADRNRLLRHLAAGEPVFGIFSGDQTPEQGAAIVEETGADFILYSMESGPFDVEGMVAYMDGMREAGGPGALSEHPVLLRVPPIGEASDSTGERVARALDAGVAGIVFPHVDRAESAARSVEVMRDLWPGDPDGSLVDVLIVEDRAGIERVDDIVATPGLSVVFAGPGDLRRAYDGDMEAVERAIQAVLAACLEHDVACGVTAGADDIARRLEEGFRVIIVTEPEALAVGRRAAGRTEG